MDFYCLARKDGTYDLICTRCFATVISTKDPSNIQDHQRIHRCMKLNIAPAEIHPHKELRRKESIRTAHKLPARLVSIRSSVLLILGALLLYACPTVIEALLLRRINPGVGVVLFGDLVGCACIFLVLKRRRLAIAVYTITAGIEQFAYGLDLVSAQALCWIADLVPTFVAFTIFQ